MILSPPGGPDRSGWRGRLPATGSHPDFRALRSRQACREARLMARPSGPGMTDAEQYPALPIATSRLTLSVRQGCSEQIKNMLAHGGEWSFMSTPIARSPMEPRSGWLVRPDPGDRATGRRASALKRQPALHCWSRRQAAGEGSGSHRPSGSHGVGGMCPTARPRPIPEATRKGRQQDPGLPIAGSCPSARADRRRGSIRSRAPVSRLRL